jgi:formate hydrogenlyase subunit 6/NADH:ubiquinone oxidoreductase subunit I
MVKKSRIPPMLRRTVSHIFTKPATTKYPFVKPKVADDFRGETKYQIKSCNVIELGSPDALTLDVKSIVGVNCSVCVRDCPAKAIEIVEVDGKRRPQFDFTKCVFCYQCVESCPRKAIKTSDFYELATTDKKSLVKKPNLKAPESVEK